MEIDPPVPGLVEDADNAELTLGIGLAVQAASAVDYTLHGILANMCGVKLAYNFASGESGHGLVAMCFARLGLDKSGRSPFSPKKEDKKWLDATSAPDLPPAAREALVGRLRSYLGLIDSRNQFAHSVYSRFDDGYRWVAVKGPRGQRKNVGDASRAAPEWSAFEAAEIWELAAEIRAYNQFFIEWDSLYYGVAGDPENGEPLRVSVKRLSNTPKLHENPF